MIKAVIFDMDGTLLNTLCDLKISTNYALEKLNMPQRTVDEIKNFIGDGVRKLIERAVSKNADEKTINKCLEIFKEHYSKNMYNNTAPFDGIIELLKSLKQMKIKTGVVSNKFDSAIKELTKKYFNNLIDISIGQSEIIPPKPDSKGILKAMEYLNIKKEEVLYIGDSDVDIKTAKNAKVKSIGVLWGYRDESYLKGADYIISNPSEILKIINSINQ